MLSEEPPVEKTDSVPARSHRGLRRQRRPKPISERKRVAALRNLQKAREVGARLPRTPAQKAASLRTIKAAQEAIRGRPRKLSPAQLAAVRHNVARARAAMARRGRTPEHLAKLRETIKLARAARTRESYELHNAKVLRHGMYARFVRSTMLALGQDTDDLHRRVDLLARYFVSAGPDEQKLLYALAEALWRRERLYYAQAEWESQQIYRLLQRAPAAYELHPYDLSMRGLDLLEPLYDHDRFFDRDHRLAGTIQRLLRRLFRVRFGPKFQFQTSFRI